MIGSNENEFQGLGIQFQSHEDYEHSVSCNVFQTQIPQPKRAIAKGAIDTFLGRDTLTNPFSYNQDANFDDQSIDSRAMSNTGHTEHFQGHNSSSLFADIHTGGSKSVPLEHDQHLFTRPYPLNSLSSIQQIGHDSDSFSASSNSPRENNHFFNSSGSLSGPTGDPLSLSPRESGSFHQHAFSRSQSTPIFNDWDSSIGGNIHIGGALGLSADPQRDLFRSKPGNDLNVDTNRSFLLRSYDTSTQLLNQHQHVNSHVQHQQQNVPPGFHQPQGQNTQSSQWRPDGGLGVPQGQSHAQRSGTGLRSQMGSYGLDSNNGSVGFGGQVHQIVRAQGSYLGQSQGHFQGSTGRVPSPQLYGHGHQQNAPSTHHRDHPQHHSQQHSGFGNNGGIKAQHQQLTSGSNLSEAAVEETVCKTCRDILIEAANRTLKAVELANTLRARVGTEVLGFVREKWGGLLALLERHPFVFRVDRIPKNDLVTLLPPKLNNLSQQSQQQAQQQSQQQQTQLHVQQQTQLHVQQQENSLSAGHIFMGQNQQVLNQNMMQQLPGGDLQLRAGSAPPSLGSLLSPNYLLGADSHGLIHGHPRMQSPIETGENSMFLTRPDQQQVQTPTTTQTPTLVTPRSVPIPLPPPLPSNSTGAGTSSITLDPHAAPFMHMPPLPSGMGISPSPPAVTPSGSGTNSVTVSASGAVITTTSKDSQPSRCLHIGNVPTTLNENQLLTEFEQFGEVESLKVVTQRNRRFAFVTYSTLEQSIVAKQRMSKIQSWKSAISFAHKESYGTSHSPASSTSNTPSPGLPNLPLDGQQQMSSMDYIIQQHRLYKQQQQVQAQQLTTPLSVTASPGLPIGTTTPGLDSSSDSYTQQQPHSRSTAWFGKPLGVDTSDADHHNIHHHHHQQQLPQHDQNQSIDIISQAQTQAQTQDQTQDQTQAQAESQTNIYAQAQIQESVALPVAEPIQYSSAATSSIPPAPALQHTTSASSLASFRSSESTRSYNLALDVLGPGGVNPGRSGSPARQMGRSASSDSSSAEYQTMLHRLHQHQQHLSSYPSPRSSPLPEGRKQTIDDPVLRRLCDETYVPTQQWPIDPNLDPPFCLAVVSQLRQFGGQTTVSKLRGFLRNRLQSPDNIKSVPLKALLGAYPNIFKVVGNHVSLIGPSASGPSGVLNGSTSDLSRLGFPQRSVLGSVGIGNRSARSSRDGSHVNFDDGCGNGLGFLPIAEGFDGDGTGEGGEGIFDNVSEWSATASDLHSQGPSIAPSRGASVDAAGPPSALQHSFSQFYNLNQNLHY